MSLIQALFIAIVQGVTELFPVSSLGHAVVLPKLLGWDVDQSSEGFLPFLVVLHLGTAAALLIYFWRDWIGILFAFIGMGPGEERRAQWRLLWMIIVATIPAVILGFALEKPLKTLFSAPTVAAFFLIVNGGVLFIAERLRRRGATGNLAQLTWLGALIIGCTQATALIPGISRSGATIVAGLLRGIDHAGAAHFSFLIATPIIFGATVLEAPKLLHADIPPGVFALSAVAALVAGVTAWLSTWFLMRYFRQHDQWALNPFGYYCIVVGLASLGYLLIV
jgi:undecaprenyl-diphosphatase